VREVGGDGPRTGCEPRSEHGRTSLFWTSLKELKVGRQCQKIQAQIDIETCTFNKVDDEANRQSMCVCQTRDSSWNVTRPVDQLPPTDLDYAIRQMPSLISRDHQLGRMP
jgi:hypothetical protein